MRRQRRKREYRDPIPLLPGALLFACSFLVAGCGQKPQVETLHPYRGPIRESFSEPAKTRLDTTHRITLPVAGRIGRIDLEPGDPVVQGQVLAEYDLEPLSQAVAEARASVLELEASILVKEDNRLEETALSNAEAMVKASSETLKAVDAQVEAEAVRADRATRELDRMQNLASQEATTQRSLDDAETDAETKVIDLRRQELYRAAFHAVNVAVNLGPSFVRQYMARKVLEREVLVHQLAQAKARLAEAEHNLGLASITSPIEGVVLERFQQGEGTLPAGEPLLLLGNLGALEVEAEVLTQDALLLNPGSEVLFEPAARLEPIVGRVKTIEPAGFTKLSSLGVEQQRVKVIASLQEPHGALGVGYRVRARFFTGSKEEALIVPRYSILQAPDESYYVLTVAENRIVKQPIALGLRSDLEIEVTAGLDSNALLVAHPETTLQEGMGVDPLPPK